MGAQGETGDVARNRRLCRTCEEEQTEETGNKASNAPCRAVHSHSIVPGGLEVKS